MFLRTTFEHGRYGMATTETLQYVASDAKFAKSVLYVLSTANLNAGYWAVKTRSKALATWFLLSIMFVSGSDLNIGKKKKKREKLYIFT